MSVQAQVDGIGTLEFPDGTDPAVIHATVQKMIAQKNPTPAATATPAGPHNPFVASGQDELSNIRDASDLAMTSLMNAPHHIYESVKDFFSGGINRTPGPAHLTPATTADLQPGIIPQAIGEGASAADAALGRVSPTAQDILHHTGRVAGDVLDVAGAVAPVKAGFNMMREVADQIPAAMTKYGMRTGADNPIARTVAGESGRPAVTAHNQAIADPAIGAQAGVHPDTPLSQKALEDAQAGPNSVYERAKAAIPTGPLSPKAEEMIRAVSGDDLVVHSPDVQAQVAAQKSRLLPTVDANGETVPNNLTGTQIVDTSKSLRYNGFRNVASEDPEMVALGSAQLKMADALHQHMLDTIPDTADVTPAQLAKARQALAQNYTVGGLLKGNNVDLQALARLHRNAPQLLTGPLRDMAEFADLHPEVTGLPSNSERFNPSGVGKDLAAIDLKSPVTYAQPLFGAAARRVLTGPPKAPNVPVTGAAGEFAPIDRTPQPPPGLTAGPMGAPPSAPVRYSTDIPSHELLSHGIEAEPEAGLSASAPEAPSREGIPFQVPPESVGKKPNRSGRQTQPEKAPSHMFVNDEQIEPSEPIVGNRFDPGKSLMEELEDLASVMHQNRSTGVSGAPGTSLGTTGGVPEGIMTPTPRVNRGGSDAGSIRAASPEAMNRGTRNVIEIDPDGRPTPVLKDVTQIDAKAPKGHLLMDQDTGEILDRGGMSIGNAEGLRNRYRAMHARPAPTLMDLLEASGG